MKRIVKLFLLGSLAFSLLEIIPLTAQSDTIHFKNGTRLDIEEVWVDNGKVKCIMFGNEYEYDTKDVKSIERNGLITKIDNPSTARKKISPKKQPNKDYHEITDDDSLKLHEEALLFVQKAKWQKAIQKEKQAYAINPNDKTIQESLAYFYTMYAMAFYQKGQFDETLQNCNEALNIIPEYSLAKECISQVYVTRAKTAYDQRDFGAAEIYLREASHYFEDNPYVYILYGKIAYDKDQYENAKQQWQRALEINPNLGEVRILLQKFAQEHRVEEKFEKKNSGNFSVKFEGTQKSEIADEAIQILQDAYIDVGNELGEYPKHAIEVIIYPKSDIKELDYYPDMAAGLYDGKIRFSEDLINDRNYFKAVLYHEYTHVIVHIKGGRNVPIWLNEGLAEYCSRKYKTASHINSRDNLLKAAAKKNAIIPFRHLSMTSLAGLKRLSYPLIALLYAQSDSFVSYMVEKFTIYDMQTVLTYIGNGESAQTAIVNTINYSLDDLEAEWKESLLK